MWSQSRYVLHQQLPYRYLSWNNFSCIHSKDEYKYIKTKKLHTYAYFLCDFDRASSLICGNKMPTRCNRGFYCRSAQHVSGTTMPIIGSSRVLYSGCCLWYFVLWFSSCWSSVERRVMCPVCRMLQHPANCTKYHRQQLLYNTLELLMMGIVVPATCWASNKICNKNLCCI